VAKHEGLTGGRQATRMNVIPRTFLLNE